MHATTNDGMDEQSLSGPQHEHREGKVARAIEQQTAKLPSDMFLWAALGSMGASLALGIAGRGKRRPSSGNGRRRSLSLAFITSS
jgi:hypothetical protein